MTNPTSNFGWQMPTSTDLVTDLPADFEVFGQAVDTDFVDLLGGTTGQVLSKTSNTDLDFTWVAANPGDITGVTAGTGISGGGTSGTVTVSIDTAVTADLTTSQTLTNKTLTSPALTTPTISTLTTNGDLLYGTGSGALARKAIGSTGQVLTVAAGIPSWATPSAGSLTKIQTSTFTGVTSTTTTFDGVFTSTYKNYMITMSSLSGQASQPLLFQLRNAGATISSAGYSGARLNNATVTSFSSATSVSVLVLQVAGTTGSINMTFNRSQSPTQWSWFGFDRLNVTTILGACIQDNTNSNGSDGFILSAAAGNIAGTVTIYGLAD
jgi:hypothetical protein